MSRAFDVLLKDRLCLLPYYHDTDIITAVITAITRQEEFLNLRLKSCLWPKMLRWNYCCYSIQACKRLVGPKSGWGAGGAVDIAAGLLHSKEVFQSSQMINSKL